MADEDITDLTGDETEASGAKSEGKQKKEKAPKAKALKEKKQKPSKEAGDTDEKKSGAGGVILIMILVLILLIGGFAAAVYFNVFQARLIVADVINEPLTRLIIWLDPGFSGVSEQLRADAEEQQKQLTELANDFETRDTEITLREDALNTREQQLDRRASELNSREQQILAMYERTIPLYRRDDRTEQELEDMMSLSRTYTSMAPEAAAEIMLRLHDPRDVAAILYYMSERNAASILAAFKPEYAAEITEILLYY